MAPNQKQISLISQSLGDLKVLQAKSYVEPVAPATVDTDSYWEWKDPSDMFSVGHIVRNLVAAAAIEDQSDCLVEEHTLYWAERTFPAGHEVENAVSSILREEIPMVERTVPANDEYWTMSNHRPTASDDYWRM